MTTSGLKRTLKRSALWAASRLGRHRLSGSQPQLWVLMYHRILPASDPRFAAEEPGMLVTPETFRQHLRELKRLFTLLPLSEWVERRRNGAPLPQRACAVTFDDGWLDNYEYALPILEAERVPATLFAVSHMIGTHREFWPNRLSRVLRAEGMQLHHAPLRWLIELGANASAATMDREQIARIILACKQLPDDELSARLDVAEAMLGISASPTPALVSWEQLRAMQASGHIEVGSHTCNHYRLIANLDPAIMAREITESRLLLERELGKPITLFCYPNGDASAAAVDLVRKHYGAAVTTQRGINDRSFDLHSLQRIGVHEDVSNDTTSFQARLSGWL